MIKELFTKGTYYIGDPCYIVLGEEGYQWIEAVWDHFYGGHKGKITVNGVELFLQNTYEGDGAFDGFYVDSGCLAVVKIDQLLNDNRFNFKNMTIRGAMFVDFDHDFEVTYDEGKFIIDNAIVINTNLS